MKNLESGLIIGNFVLVVEIKDMCHLDNFLKSKKLIFARHKMYPTAFIISMSFRTVSTWLKNGWFWYAEKVTK